MFVTKSHSQLVQASKTEGKVAPKAVGKFASKALGKKKVAPKAEGKVAPKALAKEDNIKVEVKVAPKAIGKKKVAPHALQGKVEKGKKRKAFSKKLGTTTASGVFKKPAMKKGDLPDNQFFDTNWMNSF